MTRRAHAAGRLEVALRGGWSLKTKRTATWVGRCPPGLAPVRVGCHRTPRDGGFGGGVAGWRAEVDVESRGDDSFALLEQRWSCVGRGVAVEGFADAYGRRPHVTNPSRAVHRAVGCGRWATCSVTATARRGA